LGGECSLQSRREINGLVRTAGAGDSDEITWEENARSNHGERLTD